MAAAATPPDSGDRTKRRRATPWLLAAIAILLVAATAWYALAPRAPNASTAATKGRFGGFAGRRGGDAAAFGTLPVAVATARTTDFPVYLNALGNVTARNTVTVRPRVEGQLARVLFKEGQVVKEGDLLAQIDPRPFEVQVTQASGQLARDQAQLANARIDLERYRTLLAQDSIARQQVDTQEALVRQYQGSEEADRGAVENAKLQLSYTRITAPIGGRLGLRQVDAGNVVRATDANGIVVITQAQPIGVVFSIPEDRLTLVRRRLAADATLPVDAYDRDGKQKLATGRLLTIDNQAASASGGVRGGEAVSTMSHASRVRLAIVAAALTLAACTVGPDYVRPDVKVPDAWKEAPYKTAEPADANPRGDWWSSFGDPLLERLESDVVAANPSLRAAEANHRQAQAALRAARAGLFPDVAGTVQATRARAGEGHGATSTNLSLGAQLSWEIDLWGRVRRAVEASADTAQASAAELANARLSLQADLAQSYLALRVADAQRKVLEETVAAYERSVKLTQNRYDAGVAARADVVQAQTQLLAAKVQRVDVAASRAQLEHAIAALTGRLPSEISVARVDALPNVPDIPPGVPSTLLERRPDVAAAERRVAAANAQVGVATAALYPDLTLSAGAGLGGSALANWLSLPNRFWSIGPQLAATLFDAGLRKGQRDEQVAAYDATVATYRQTVLSAFREVEDNLSTLRILGDEAEVQAQALAAARESVALTTNQYKAGLVGIISVILVQAQAFAAERNTVELQGRRYAAAVALIKAVGGGYRERASEPTAANR